MHCSFVDPLVKGIDNFWKFLGIIDGFNELRRQISYGVGKTSDESMIAIQFCTTLKGYLPHYSYIFMQPGPLRTEIKNVACSVLGTMLLQESQRGEEAMKALGFQKYIGGTVVCINILAMDTKGCGQLTSNDTYFADSWFSSIKIDEEVMAEGVDYCGPVKTIHKGFCLSYVRKVDERLAGRVISCYEDYSKISWW